MAGRSALEGAGGVFGLDDAANTRETGVVRIVEVLAPEKSLRQTSASEEWRGEEFGVALLEVGLRGSP